MIIRNWVWIAGIGIAAVLLIWIAFRWDFSKGSADSSSSMIAGNFVVILLDGNSKPSRYWVLQNDTVDLKEGWAAFDEKDGQTIHLHGNVIVKEFDGDQALADIKKQYELK